MNAKMLLVGFVCTGMAMGQSVVAPMAAAGKLPAFDVTSVKQHPSGENRMSSKYRSDGFICSNLTLLNLIVNVYGIDQDKISGGPSWIDSIGFDIEAKVAGPDVAAFKKLGPEQRNDLLKNLLADRFKLKVHSAAKMRPMYDMVVAKGGPKLKLSALVDPKAAKPRSRLDTAPGTFEAERVSMEAVARQLSSTLHVPVVDKTGLTALYDVDLKWSPEDAGPSNGDAAADSSPSIFTAVQEQLGLKLTPTKGPTETLVIDHAEKPSVN
jgi:uncharacterized protein (TIGR03435 family)